MKVIPLAEAHDRADEIAEVVASGGLACFPMRGAYRIAADVRSEDAVMRLMQSKRRAKVHPTLVLVADLVAARGVVTGTTWKTTQRLAKMWPGPLTLVLPPSDDLPVKVRKVLTRATGKLGVRVPDDTLTRRILTELGGSMLLSSANLEKKPGASSASAVRQRFVQTVDIWVDAGDLTPAPSSTIIEVSETSWKSLRDGAIPLADIERAAA
ncbi:MAG: L-threonylcarbamoyladenylate synthase [Proteobacteria bacterium]|nr:L-threonylcarbamoyladenylate synthase [Pseudomonadota bacterium]